MLSRGNRMQRLSQADGATAADGNAVAFPPLDTTRDLEEKISRAVAAVPAWRHSTSSKTTNDTADLVHRIAVTEALLDAAKATLKERTVQVAVLVDTINVLQASIDGAIDGDDDDDDDEGCGCAGSDCCGVDVEGGRRSGGCGCVCCGDRQHGGGYSPRQFAALSRRVVDLTAQVVAMAKGSTTSAVQGADAVIANYGACDPWRTALLRGSPMCPRQPRGGGGALTSHHCMMFLIFTWRSVCVHTQSTAPTIKDSLS